MRGERSAATGAIGHDLEALVEKSLIPDLLESPPLRLDKVVGVGDVGIVHISPEANGAGEVLPHFLVLPDGFLTVTDEGLKAVVLDLLLAVDAELLLDLKLNGKAVCIPACLTDNASALHGVISRNHILDNTGQNVTDMRLAVCCGRAVKEGKVLATLTDVDTLLEDLILLPEFSRRFFSLDEIEVRRDSFVNFHSENLLYLSGCVPFFYLYVALGHAPKKIKNPSPYGNGINHQISHIYQYALLLR